MSSERVYGFHVKRGTSEREEEKCGGSVYSSDSDISVVTYQCRTIASNKTNEEESEVKEIT